MVHSKNSHTIPEPVATGRVSARQRNLSTALAALFAFHFLLLLTALALNPAYYVTLASKSLVSCLFLVTTVIACIQMYSGAIMLGMGRLRGRLRMVFTGAFYGLLISAATWWPDNAAAMLGISGLALTAAGAWLAHASQRELSENGRLLAAAGIMALRQTARAGLSRRRRGTRLQYARAGSPIPAADRRLGGGIRCMGWYDRPTAPPQTARAT